MALFFFIHEKLTGYFKNLLIVYWVDFVYKSNKNGFMCAMSDLNLLTLTVSKRDIVIRSIWWYTLILICLFLSVFLFSLRHTSFDKYRFSFIGELRLQIWSNGDAFRVLSFASMLWILSFNRLAYLFRVFPLFTVMWLCSFKVYLLIVEYQ